MKQTKFIFVFLVFSIFINTVRGQNTFLNRARFAVGAGGAIAFKSLGGIQARAYTQFAPRWKLMATATNMFRYDIIDKANRNAFLYDLNLAHSIKRYNDYDVFYVFAGLNAEDWKRKDTLSLPFRVIDIKNKSNNTSKFVISPSVGAGFEKHIGLIGIYTELKLSLAAKEWIMITFGFKTNFKRIFKGPGKKYDLDLDEMIDEAE